MKKLKFLAFLIAALALAASCGKAEERLQDRAEALQTVADSLKEIKDDLDSGEKNDDSNYDSNYLSFTISGYGGGSFRLEGEDAAEGFNVMSGESDTEKAITIAYYDEKTKTDIRIIGGVDLAISGEQTTGGLFQVAFNQEKGTTHIANWQDYFDPFAYGAFYPTPEGEPSSLARWIVQSEKLSGGKIRFKGSATFDASNSPMTEADNTDSALVLKVNEEASRNGGRIPTFNPEVAGTEQITVRCEFDLIATDYMSYLKELTGE
jgi:hypothetical protein